MKLIIWFADPFNKKSLMKHKELLPIVAIPVFASFLTVGILTWACFRKEFNFVRSRPRIDESMDFLHPYSLKLMVIDRRTLLPKRELHETYKEMAMEEKKRRREDEKNCD